MDLSLNEKCLSSLFEQAWKGIITTGYAFSIVDRDYSFLLISVSFCFICRCILPSSNALRWAS